MEPINKDNLTMIQNVVDPYIKVRSIEYDNGDNERYYEDGTIMYRCTSEGSEFYRPTGIIEKRYDSKTDMTMYYNEDGRLKLVCDNVGDEKKYEYDEKGNIIRIETKVATLYIEEFKYDKENRLTYKKNSNGEETFMIYNDNDNTTIKRTLKSSATNIYEREYLIVDGDEYLTYDKSVDKQTNECIQRWYDIIGKLINIESYVWEEE